MLFRYDVSDPMLWKGVSEDAIQSMRATLGGAQLTLSPSLIDPHHTAANLEHQLKRYIPCQQFMV